MKHTETFILKIAFDAGKDSFLSGELRHVKSGQTYAFRDLAELKTYLMRGKIEQQSNARGKKDSRKEGKENGYRSK